MSRTAAERVGELRELDEDLWVADRPLRVGGVFAIGTRMTVIRLGNGELFLHSPVAPDAETRRALDALGPVRHVVAPNKVHHLFAAGYRTAYPEAVLHAAPGLREKRPEISFDAVLSDEAPTAWSDEIEQLVFGGAPYVNEVVFFHPKSRTLLLTDLAFNTPEADGFATRAILRLMGVYGRFGPSRLFRSLIRDRAAARASLDRILSWDFERVTVTHGVVLQRSGRRLLREAYAWLEAG